MAASAYLTYNDGKAEIPEELQREWSLRNGARLCISYSSSQQVIVRHGPVKQPGRQAQEWRLLRGSLAGLGVDLNAELNAEGLKENQLGEREG